MRPKPSLFASKIVETEFVPAQSAPEKERKGGLFKPIPCSEPPTPSKPAVKSMVSDELMTDEQVMALLKVNLQWLRDHTTRTEPIIPHVRLGRIIRYRRSDVNEFLNALVERRPVWKRDKQSIA